MSWRAGARKGNKTEKRRKRKRRRRERRRRRGRREEKEGREEVKRKKVIGLEREKNKTAFSRDCIITYIEGPKS